MLMTLAPDAPKTPISSFSFIANLCSWDDLPRFVHESGEGTLETSASPKERGLVPTRRVPTEGAKHNETTAGRDTETSRLDTGSESKIAEHGDDPSACTRRARYKQTQRENKQQKGE